MGTTAERSNLSLVKEGPGGLPLYFNNVGLFSDTFLKDHLPNIDL